MSSKNSNLQKIIKIGKRAMKTLCSFCEDFEKVVRFIEKYKFNIMKYIFIVFMTLIIIRCTSYKGLNELNENIDISQRECLNNPHFQNRNLGLSSFLNIQKSFRYNYINVIDSILIHSTDTIILRESFSFICINCCADHVDIFTKNISKSYIWDYHKKTYEGVETNLIFNDDILELKSEIRKDDTIWNENPYKYGIKDVLDGGHTFYSIIYPDRKIESMYIRAWRSKQYRK